jgi:hypothetical protein
MEVPRHVRSVRQVNKYNPLQEKGVASMRHTKMTPEQHREYSKDIANMAETLLKHGQRNLLSCPEIDQTLRILRQLEKYKAMLQEKLHRDNGNNWGLFRNIY